MLNFFLKSCEIESHQLKKFVAYFNMNHYAQNWWRKLMVCKFLDFFCYEGSKAQSTQKVLPRASGTSSADHRTPFRTDFSWTLKSPKLVCFMLYHCSTSGYCVILRNFAEKAIFEAIFTKKNGEEDYFQEKIIIVCLFCVI